MLYQLVDYAVNQWAYRCYSIVALHQLLMLKKRGALIEENRESRVTSVPH